MAAADSERAVLLLTPAQRRDAVRAGREWLKSPRVPVIVQEWWDQIWENEGEAIYVGVHERNAPNWWLPALLVLIAADEAAEDVGYAAPNAPLGKQPWFADVIAYAFSYKAAGPSYADALEGPSITIDRNLYSIAALASPDVACVLPKSRTAPVGNTLRSLSHNLAFLPPQGIVRTSWFPRRGTARCDNDPMNLLLIPFPFEISAKDFKGRVIARKDKNIGWFHLQQLWLNPEPGALKAFTDYIEHLITVAQRDVDAVHGLVFPELALNWQFYDALRRRIADAFPHVELLVAGLGDYPVREQASKGASDRLNRLLVRGNFAITTCFLTSESTKRPTPYIEFARPKHHRWRLDGSQIARYGLGAALDPSLSWWEDISLTWRELDIAVVRDSGTLTTLICEDLARLDPSQIALRAVGPNLVFALLMDGPQLAWRWAARNATVLAEDPGSAVLTLTSMGLLNRMNQASTPNGTDRCIGLWKEDNGRQHEIHLQRGSDAVLLTLSAVHKKEWTLDGRGDGSSALAWSLSGERCVTAQQARPPWINPT